MITSLYFYTISLNYSEFHKKDSNAHYFCILWMIALARQGASSGCMSPYSLKSDSSTLYLITSLAALLISNNPNYLSAWGRFRYAIPRYPPAPNAITRGITIQLAKNAFPLDESINPVIVLEPMNIMIEITITMILASRWEVYFSWNSISSWSKWTRSRSAISLRSCSIDCIYRNNKIYIYLTRIHPH